MATNTPGGADNLDAIIRTVFTTEGDAKTEAVIKRLQARQQQYYADIQRRAKETATTTQLINRALLDLDRQNALDKISRDFTKAAKSGKDFEGALKRLRGELEQVGATQAEVNRVIAQGAAAQGTGRGAALQAFGREARLAVPAVSIPGTGVSTEFLFKASEIAGRLNLNFKDLAIGGGAAAFAIIGVTLALKNFEATIGPVARTLQAVQNARIETAGLLATGDAAAIVQARQQALDDTVELEAELAQAEQDLATQRRSLDRATINLLHETIVQGQAPEAGQVVDAGLSFLTNVAGDLGAGPIGDAKRKVDDLNAKLADADVVLSALNPEYQRYVDQLEAERIQRLQEGNLDTVRAAELTALQGTPEALNARIEAIQRENELIERDLNTYALSAEKQDALNQQLELNNAIIDRLNGSVRQQVEETDRLAKAEEYLKDQRKEITALTEKAQADLERIEQQTAQRRLELQQRFNDRLVDLAQKAADSAEDALRKLEQKRADLAGDLGTDLSDIERETAQDRLDIAIDHARDDAKAAREHADRIQEIERRSRVDSRKAAQDRDAIALQAAEDRLTDDLQSENARFETGKRERDIAYREELQDQQTQYAREREARFQKYERDLQEAQQQYEREQQQLAINQARQVRDLEIVNQRETALLNQKNIEQQQLIRTAYTQELEIVSQGQAARLQLEAQHQTQLLALAARFQNTGSFNRSTPYGGQLPTLAGGGDLGAGQTALVNEIRRESYTNRRGRTIQLPEGMGLFTPTQAGRVNTNSGGATLNVNIEGATVKTIEVTSRQQALRVIGELLDDQAVI